MKNVLISSLALIMAVSIAGCRKGNGDLVTRSLSLGSFDEIHLKVDADVFVRQGPGQEIIVIGEEDVLDRLDGRIRDDEWEIDFTRNVGNYERLEIQITIQDIDKLKVSGNGKIVGVNLFDVGDIDLETRGSGMIDVNLDANKVKSKIDGSGNINIVGTANRHEIDINGSGNLRSFGLLATTVDAKLSGSGDAQVHAQQNLKVRLNGSGSLFYRGSPNDIDIEITGSGNVIQQP